MTKPTVTDDVLDAAEIAYDNQSVLDQDERHHCYRGPMRAAITAAIEASGLVEENARLRERADKLEACIKVIRLGHNTGKFEPLQMAIEFAEQFINKEPKP